jgi:hypothetical protein
MKILSIGDIHGRDIWKFITHESSYDYNLWRVAIDNGADPQSSMWKDLLYSSYDKIVFVGDYVDSFDVSSIVIKKNLEDIIHFKRTLGDKVVLLLGNHDVQYIVHNERCSGYRPEMNHDLYDIFTKNIDLFKLAHEETGSDGSKWLWTHAGVTSGWFNKQLLPDMMHERYRFTEIVKEFDPLNKSVSDVINKAWELRMDSIFNVDPYSGGIDLWAGPVWVRPAMLNYYSLEGYNQVVGHTPQRDIKIVEEDDEGKKFKGYKHYFIDCLEHGSEKPFTIEI